MILTAEAQRRRVKTKKSFSLCLCASVLSLILSSCSSPPPQPVVQLKDGVVAVGDSMPALVADGRQVSKVRLLGVSRNAVELRRDRPARFALSGRIRASLGVLSGAADTVTFTITGGDKTETLPVAAANGWVEIDLTFPPGTTEIAFACDAPGSGAFVAGVRSVVPGPTRLAGLIIIDALRADGLGIYGAPGNPSPNIDAFARQSAVFMRAHTAAPFTLSSMGSIWTGMWPWQHQVIFTAEGGLSLSAEVPSLVTAFRDAGYHTVGFSGAYFSFADNGFARGFELMDESCADQFFYESADCLARRVTSFIESHPDEPLFIYVHFVDTHAPYWPPEPFRSKFTAGLKKPGDDDTARGLIDQFEANRKWWQFYRKPSATDLAWLRGLYQGEVAYVDDRIGPLLKKLADRCQPTDAMRVDCSIFITADHGEAFFEHGQMDHVADLHEPVMRVPLILKFGDPREYSHAAQSVPNQAPARSIDLMPTLLELSGIKAPKIIPGGSLARHLGPWATSRLDIDSSGVGPKPPLEEPTTENSAPAVAIHFVKGQPEYALVMWPWKLFYRPDSNWLRLYNLEADPKEQNDLSAAKPEKVAELQKELDRQLALPPPVGIKPTPANADTLRRMRQLNYIQQKPSQPKK